MSIARPGSSFESIEDVMYGTAAAKGLMAALDLGIFQQLEEGESTAEDLAGRIGVIAARLEPLLDLLAARGILAKSKNGYANTAASSEYLVAGKPLYQGKAMALNMHFSASLENGLVEALRCQDNDRGKSDASWAMDEIMEGTASHALTGGLYRVTRLVSGLPGFSDMRHMCDVGGNHGDFTMALLDVNPYLDGIILDLSHVVPLSEKRCRQRGYGARVTAKTFDLRVDSLDEGAYDLVLASHILYGVAEDLGGSVGKLGGALRPGGWLVSHHFAPGNRDAGTEACHELLTRLAGYPTHFLPREALEEAMAANGFGDFVAEMPVSPLGGGLILAGRKLG